MNRRYVAPSPAMTPQQPSFAPAANTAPTWASSPPQYFQQDTQTTTTSDFFGGDGGAANGFEAEYAAAAAEQSPTKSGFDYGYSNNNMNETSHSSAAQDNGYSYYQQQQQQAPEPEPALSPRPAFEATSPRIDDRVATTPSAHRSEPAPFVLSTPTAPSSMSRALASVNDATPTTSALRVVSVPVDARVDVRREPGEPTVRVVRAQPEDLHAQLVGTYVMSAAKVSFWKLPESVARIELENLIDAKKPFSLVISSGPPGTPESSSSAQKARRTTGYDFYQQSTPSPYSGARYSEDVASSGTKMSNNFNAPVTTTPLPKRTLTYEETDATTTSTQLRSPTPDDAVRASVDRLRAQRVAAEELRRSSQEKTVRIAALQSELRQLEQVCGDQSKELEALRLVASQAKANEEVLAATLRQRDDLLAELERQRVEAREREAKASQETLELREELENTKTSCFDVTEDYRLRCVRVEAEAESLRLSEAQLRSELSSAVQREEDARRLVARAREEIEERLSLSERASERARADGERAIQRGDRLEKELAETKTAVSALTSQRDQLQHRVALGDHRATELQGNLETLRRQLEEQAERELQREQATEEALSTMRAQLEQALKNESEARRAYMDAKREHETKERESRAMLEEMTKRQSETKAKDETVARLERHVSALESQLADVASRSTSTHQRLLSEMAKTQALVSELEEERKIARELARTRLDLLTEFVEEERRLEGALAPAVFEDQTQQLHPSSACRPATGSASSHRPATAYQTPTARYTR